MVWVLLLVSFGIVRCLPTDRKSSFYISSARMQIIFNGMSDIECIERYPRPQSINWYKRRSKVQFESKRQHVSPLKRCISASHYLPFLSFPRCYLNSAECSSPTLDKLPTDHFWSPHFGICYSDKHHVMPSTVFYRSDLEIAMEHHNYRPDPNLAWVTAFPYGFCYAVRENRYSQPFDCSCLPVFSNHSPFVYLNSSGSHVCLALRTLHSHCELEFMTEAEFVSLAANYVYQYAGSIWVLDTCPDAPVVNDFAKELNLNQSLCMNFHEEQLSFAQLIIRDFLVPILEMFSYFFKLLLQQLIRAVVDFAEFFLSGSQSSLFFSAFVIYLTTFSYFRSHIISSVVLIVLYMIFLLEIKVRPE